jgi:hypothetical protein
MSRPQRPLALHLLWLVLASLVPVCWVVASLTTSLFERDWMSATLLIVTSTALIGGIVVSAALARELKHAIGDLAIEAGMLRGGAVARLGRAVGDLQAVADALHAATARVTDVPEPMPHETRRAA